MLMSRKLGEGFVVGENEPDGNFTTWDFLTNFLPWFMNTKNTTKQILRVFHDQYLNHWL